MSTLYLDIETIPSESPAVEAFVTAALTPPANYKKPEAIEKWMSEHRAGAVDKTSLDGAFGRVCCIGYAVDDDPAMGMRMVLEDIHEAEADLLRRFAGVLREVAVEVYVGHNISRFDLRFLYHRACVHQVRLPGITPDLVNSRPRISHGGGAVSDTMWIWEGSGAGNHVSLDKIAMALGLPSSKTGLSGSQVAGAWREGRFDEIVEYCKGDVELTRTVFKRLVP